MNAAKKTRVANILTALATVFAVIQTFLTSPPFSPEMISVGTALLTYAVLISTTWKQYLSPEVTDTGVRITIWIAVVATLTGLLDLMHIVNFSPIVSQYIKWGITVAVAIINILSKQLFPSTLQKENMHDLKKIS